MDNMSVPNRSLCPTLKGWKWGYLVFDRKRLEPRKFPWQWHYGYCSISLVMNISGVRFEEHCFYISRDILYSVFCQTDDVIIYLICIIQKMSISLNWKKDIPKKENTILIFFWKGFQISSNYFSFHRHFNSLF